MGNRFGLHGLEAASAHSERDVGVGRISNRPIEVPVTESRSDFGSSCPDPKVSQTKIVPRHNGARTWGREGEDGSFLCYPEDCDKEDVRLPCATSYPAPRHNGVCCPEDFRTAKEMVESSPKRYSSILCIPEDVRTVEISESSTTHTAVSYTHLTLPTNREV